MYETLLRFCVSNLYGIKHLGNPQPFRPCQMHGILKISLKLEKLGSKVSLGKPSEESTQGTKLG